MRFTRHRAVLIGVLAVTATVAAGCVQDTSSSGTGEGTSTSSGGKDSGTIALLLPESKTTRYEAFDRPFFEAKVTELCPDCKVLYSNADQDAAKQQQQAESAITEGVDVMVLDPVDSASAATIVNSAKNANIPVISYDRFVTDSPIDYYISFDNEKVGELQGTTLVEGLKAEGKDSGDIVMINGSPTDNNATLFKKGAHSVLDSSGYSIVAEFDTPDWSPDEAQNWMDGQLASLPPNSLAAVYAANDGTAGGAIAAMRASGLTTLPLVTGQDAELAAIQRILTGDQYMTVYKAIKPEAEAAADMAVQLLRGETPKTDSEVNGIPSVLLEPVAVTKDNIADTIVKDEFYTVEEICGGEAAAACAEAGIS